MQANLKFVRYGTVTNPSYDVVKSYTPQEQVKFRSNGQTYEEYLCNAKIVFTPINLLKKLTKWVIEFVINVNHRLIEVEKKHPMAVLLHLFRYSTKFDVILFDNASQIDEIYSTLPFLFKPSAFIMFGDCYRKPKDTHNLNSKYNCTLNQSMFHRLVQADKNVLTLKHTLRYSDPVLKFLNNFYDQSLQPYMQRPIQGMAGFALFHRSQDRLLFRLLERIMQVLQPQQYKYGIILPQNIKVDEMNGILG